MNRTLRHLAGALAASLTLATFGLAVSAAQAPLVSAACTVPPTPANEELVANANTSITESWSASPGATSYNIYRSTTAGGEGSTPYTTTTGTSFTDSGLSTTPVYFYEVSAVNSCGESARTAEDASKTPPPIGTGGSTPGVASGNSEIYYAKDALLGGFDWFQTLTGWFPQTLGSSGSASPGQLVVDMAYSTKGSLTFNDVVVPTAGLYTIEWRYAYQGGLFPGVNNRQMGLKVNGQVITTTERFPITGSFDTYQDSSLQVNLNAGTNSVSMIAVSDHGVSRVDQLIVTPATASVPSGPTNLTITPGNTSAALSWTASTSGSPTSYTIYRGTISDGEAVTPVGTVSGTTTTFTDTGLTNGKTYFYNVAANNSVGVSPDSNEVSVVPAGTVTVPPTPTGLAATAGNGSVALTWAASSGATSYSIYRGTAAGAEGATPVGTSTSTSFTDSGLTNGTTYYYTITATNSAGTSAHSAEVHAAPSATPPPPSGTQIDSGGPAASPFAADADFTGGATASVTHAIDTSAVTNPAPQAVYQSNRYGNFSYAIPGLTAGASYTVRLHFAEEYWTTAGSRIFNVSINGQQVLTNFDILATAGAEYKAVVEQFTTTADSTGKITIVFSTVKDNAQINGIEIIPG